MSRAGYHERRPAKTVLPAGIRRRPRPGPHALPAAGGSADRRL